MTCHQHRPPPPKDQPRLADGTVDMRALLAQWDAEANVGVGPPRPREVDRDR